MKFIFKFVPTSTFKEIGEDILAIVDCIQDKETLIEGISMFFCITAVYFIFLIAAL